MGPRDRFLRFLTASFAILGVILLESHDGEGSRRVRGFPSDPPSDVFGCTIVMAARDNLILVGNNEDRDNRRTIVSFVPATEKFYGRIVFGYDDAPIQGGVNDKGLFIDANALRPTGWKADPDKPPFTWSVMMSVLATCATCEEVKGFFRQYNIPALDLARFPVADRSGASMVVEYAGGQVQFVTSKTWYQIATNFVMSNVEEGDYPCWRYQTADKMLSESKYLNEELIRKVLSATHQEGRALTVYSNIYDLKKGTIRIFRLRDFDEEVNLNFDEELAKGERSFPIDSLFVNR